jgi:hypothetical protein
VANPPFPWFFTYVEDPVSGKNHPQGRTVYRPVIPITLVGPEEDEAVTFLALGRLGLSHDLRSRHATYGQGFAGDGRAT